MCNPLAIAAPDGSSEGRTARPPALGPEMRSNLLRRVRWGNVGAAGGTLLCLTAVVLWPRLAPPGPSLPSDTPHPLVAAPDEDGPAAREAAGGAGGGRQGSAGGEESAGGARPAGDQKDRPGEGARTERGERDDRRRSGRHGRDRQGSGRDRRDGQRSRRARRD